jgi:Arginine repressor
LSANKPVNEEKSKQERQKMLIEFILNGQFKTHDEIVKAFDKKGLKKALKVSQSTISRDIKELGIAKSATGVYVVDPGMAQKRKKDALAALLKLSGASIHYPVSFFCVKCDVGYERLLAAGIQDAFEIEVVGTVTDNGVVVVFTASDMVRELEKEVRGLFGNIN